MAAKKPSPKKNRERKKTWQDSVLFVDHDGATNITNALSIALTEVHVEMAYFQMIEIETPCRCRQYNYPHPRHRDELQEFMRICSLSIATAAVSNNTQTKVQKKLISGKERENTATNATCSLSKSLKVKNRDLPKGDKQRKVHKHLLPAGKRARGKVSNRRSTSRVASRTRPKKGTKK